MVDLRSEYEVESGGPGPAHRPPTVSIHQHSLFREWREGVGEDKPDVRPEVLPEEALPWVDLTPTVELDHPVASHYLSYLVDRPDSVLAALRAIGDGTRAPRWCTAPPARTGPAPSSPWRCRWPVPTGTRSIADYAASTERMEAIVDGCCGSPTYAENLRDRPMSSHVTHPETMQAFLDHVDGEYGGVERLLGRMGWTDEDTARLRAKLRG